MTCFSEIANRLRRAIRNGERLHLDQEHVIALMTSPIYPALAQLESEELADQWQHNGSDNSGSHGAPTEASGRSAGMIAPLEPDAESQLASATIAMVRRQARRNKHSRSISSATENPKNSTPTRKQV